MMASPGKISADGEHDRPEEAADDRHEEKGVGAHMAEPHDIAEGILREAGDQKQDKGHQFPLMFHKIVVLLKDARTDGLLDKGQTQPTGQDKGQPGADGQSDRRIDGSQEGAVDITADESRYFPGDGGKQDLQYLEPDKDDNGKGAERIDEFNQMLRI